MSTTGRLAAWSAKTDRLFRDHEIFVRTGGEVRFLRISARSQRRAAYLAGGAVGAWALVTVGLIGWQAYGSWQRGDLAARQVRVERAEARLAATANQSARSMAELEQRQRYTEALFERHFPGGDGDAATAVDESGPAVRTAPAGQTGSAAGHADRDQISQLHGLMQRQDRLVANLTQAISARAARAERALRGLGIAPGRGAMGGPFIPARAAAVPADPAIRRLAQQVARMEALEELLLSLPSIRPAEVIRLSSGFGYRHDPFNGRGAMHAGLDFTGAHGSPILSAARGRVSFVGVQSGYGNTVEIDHGHGIMTRYAHLSGFNVRPGQSVDGGQPIARMGSTGRSTGTHLHFEVRVGGTAVNPRRFLEANSDVLEIQANAGQRARARGGA